MRLLRFFSMNKQRAAKTPEKGLMGRVASSYNLNPANLILVRNMLAYVFYIPDNSYLKIIPEKEIPFTRINQVCLWQMFLQKQLSGIVGLNSSIKGNLSEKIEHKGRSYTVVSYVKAQGKSINSQLWKENVFYKVGKLTGSIHRVTKDYSNKIQADLIPDWNHVAGKYISLHLLKQKPLHSRFFSLSSDIRSTNISRENYGIIHSDIHRGNLKLHDKDLQIYDFEDSCHSWFANDIANIFYHALLNTGLDPELSLSRLKTFKENFWKGYLEENYLSADDLKNIPKWIALRAIFNYAYLLKAGEHKNYNPTLRKYFIQNKKFAFKEFEKLTPELFC